MTRLHKSHSLTVAITAVFVLVLIAVVLHIATSRTAEPYDFVHADRESAKKYFTNQIQRVGPSEAYKNFAASVRDVAYDKQHVFAHVFGEALYESEGLSGFSVCDLRFMYGCFHELMGRAIAENGMSIIRDVYRMCTSVDDPKPFACLHGIGHGIVASQGYTPDGLSEALDACGTLNAGDRSYWCYSGVFMEYNQQSMLGTEYVRKIDSGGDVYEPCRSVDGQYRRACVFEQPQWWFRALLKGEGSEESFASLGRYCKNGPFDDLLMRTCYEGVGNIVTPSSDFDIQRTIALCNAVSSDPAPQLFCKSMAALSFTSVLHDAQDAERVCDGLTGDSFAFCSAYAHNEANMINSIPLPESI